MTLPLLEFGKVKGAFIQTIDTLGTQARWTQAKPPAATALITVGFKTVGKGDTEIMNAYGIGAKIVTFKAGDFTTTVPEKMDSIEIGGERYTLANVNPIHLNNEVIGYKGIVRGK